ncbi:MAG: TadE family protein, partial [Phycisphaeraceae bacterium JB051]
MDPSTNHVESWLSNALGQLVTSPLLWVFIACLFGVLGCLWGLFRHAQFRRHTDVTSESGSATLEFVLIIPMLLFCTLTLAQTTLVMGGNIFVHYSAFAATRSAITTIPLNYTDLGEPRNYLVLPDGPKAQRVRQAAVFALLPVAGRLSDSSTSESQLLVEGFKSYYRDLDQEPPVWIDNFLAARLAYANA